jgi:hypothetical protein
MSDLIFDDQDKSKKIVFEAGISVLDDNVSTTNFSRVGSLRPTALMYTSGIGATTDLPHLTVLVLGLERWEQQYSKMGAKPLIVEPRLLNAVKRQLGPSVSELRRAPWAQDESGQDLALNLGVPTTLFPQWLRCTGCNLLSRAEWNEFTYENKRKHRPDQARYFHKGCRGKGGGAAKAFDRPVVAARFLLTCVDGHLDEFPYMEWVHKAVGSEFRCSGGVANPKLEMSETQSNTGPSVRVKCLACGLTRMMSEATGQKGEGKLPFCRGHHPHLGVFEKCEQGSKLMLLGAANQWFPSNISLLVMPTMQKRRLQDLVELVQALPNEIRANGTNQDSMALILMLMSGQLGINIEGITGEQLWEAFKAAKSNEVKGNAEEDSEDDPVSLLDPEWQVMRDSSLFKGISEKSEFKLFSQGQPFKPPSIVDEVVGVERLKKVNAFIGFTRVDAEDRIGDAKERLVRVSRTDQPSWVPATEDRGEGIFMRFNEDAVQNWEKLVINSERWQKLRKAHERNFNRRQSSSAAKVDPDSRLPSPRYWALHSFSHILIREMAMYAGYGAASLSERIYAWGPSTEREGAAGILISTTSADSEGTLGGLVELSSPEMITRLVKNSLVRAGHCSSDPLCARKLPVSPEDVLHGSACHFCLFVSETSCEKSNRFLDRAMVLTLQHSGIDGLFEGLRVG